MKAKINLSLFTANYFILSLFLLLLNDFYLKYEFHNFITGKLSDFAGLFIFPYFISVFFTNKTKEIYIFTFLLFIFWKLEISEQFIKFISRITDIAFYRTVDLSDLIALLILPFSFNYFHIQNSDYKNNKHRSFALNSLIGVIKIYSFLADSNPRQELKVKRNSKKEFKIQINKEQILNNLIPRFSYTNFLKTDSLITICYAIPEYRAEATAKVQILKIDKENTVIKIDSITGVEITGRLFFGFSQSDIDACEKMNSSEFEENFKTNFIDIITNKRKTEYPTYSAYKTE